ncbi:Myb DNA-bind 3 domain-containing protein [Abeliophyllum distichum]|uniref:Myb DNA-bind 3 domain-containing protein n=1 Tax=Abeliophyllum distichum TaxID=126358 RepID=A0ABD1SC01_9LAMI
MFNHEAGKDWKCSQLKNHWFNMRRDYLLLHEILRSTGIEYDHQNNTIVADDWWWERKIQPYQTVKKKGFDDDEFWESVEKSDKLPVNADMLDEHAPSEHAGSGSAMDMLGFHSGEKRKCSYGAMKGKKKLGSRSALSESVEKLATVGNELIASHLKANSRAPSLVECMEELESFGVLEGDEKFHLFSLTFFEQKRHRTSYAAARTQQMKMKFLKFNFKSWCLQNAGAFDD